jgi:hypothetical protein
VKTEHNADRGGGPHSEDEHWLAPQCEKPHRVLADNMVQHELCFLINVKPHNPTQRMGTLGDAAFSFLSSSLAHKVSTPWQPRAKAVPARPGTPHGGQMNARLQEIRRKVDSGQPLTKEVGVQAGKGPPGHPPAVVVDLGDCRIGGCCSSALSSRHDPCDRLLRRLRR